MLYTCLGKIDKSVGRFTVGIPEGPACRLERCMHSIDVVEGAVSPCHGRVWWDSGKGNKVLLMPYGGRGIGCGSAVRNDTGERLHSSVNHLIGRTVDTRTWEIYR